MRTLCEANADSAVVTGFDHSTAVFNWWGAAAGLLPWAAIPALFLTQWWIASLGILGAAGTLALAMLPLRYRVTVRADTVELERSWAGLVYKRVVLSNEPGLRFEVWGTGDWGEEGTWPGEHYCELISLGKSDLTVGTPREAEELARWSTLQAQRLVPQ
jgi:hypothetical protein